MSTRSSFKRVLLPIIRPTTTYGKDTCSKLGIYDILGPYFLGKFSFSEKHSRLERRFLLRIPAKKVEKADCIFGQNLAKFYGFLVPPFPIYLIYPHLRIIQANGERGAKNP